jgi:hypothetical protein
MVVKHVIFQGGLRHAQAGLGVRHTRNPRIHKLSPQVRGFVVSHGSTFGFRSKWMIPCLCRNTSALSRLRRTRQIMRISGRNVLLFDSSKDDEGAHRVEGGAFVGAVLHDDDERSVGEQALSAGCA